MYFETGWGKSSRRLFWTVGGECWKFGSVPYVPILHTENWRRGIWIVTSKGGKDDGYSQFYRCCLQPRHLSSPAVAGRLGARLVIRKHSLRLALAAHRLGPGVILLCSASSVRIRVEQVQNAGKMCELVLDSVRRLLQYMLIFV